MELVRCLLLINFIPVHLSVIHGYPHPFIYRFSPWNIYFNNHRYVRPFIFPGVYYSRFYVPLNAFYYPGMTYPTYREDFTNHQKDNTNCDNNDKSKVSTKGGQSYDKRLANAYRRPLINVPQQRLASQHQRNPTTPPHLNYFNFITNKDFILRLIKDKLVKLNNKERVLNGVSVNTALYDELKLLEDSTLPKLDIPVPANNSDVPPNQPKRGTEKKREGQYTALSTFMGNFFCAWCKTRSGEEKTKCLRFCFSDIIRQNGPAEETEGTGEQERQIERSRS